MTDKELKRLAQEATGIDDATQAIEETLRTYVEVKLDQYRVVIRKYEGQYGFGFEHFSSRLGRDLPLSWENEQVYLTWEEALTHVAYFEELVSQLSVHA